MLLLRSEAIKGSLIVTYSSTNRRKRYRTPIFSTTTFEPTFLHFPRDRNKTTLRPFSRSTTNSGGRGVSDCSWWTPTIVPTNSPSETGFSLVAINTTNAINPKTKRRAHFSFFKKSINLICRSFIGYPASLVNTASLHSAYHFFQPVQPGPRRATPGVAPV